MGVVRPRADTRRTRGVVPEHHPGARLGHLIVGSLLPYASFALLVIANIHHANKRIRTPLAVATYAIPVLLWIQAVLGHVNVPATIAAHIPFGIAMTVYLAVLAVVAARPAAPDPVQNRGRSSGSGPVPDTGSVAPQLQR